MFQVKSRPEAEIQYKRVAGHHVLLYGHAISAENKMESDPSWPVNWTLTLRYPEYQSLDHERNDIYVVSDQNSIWHETPTAIKDEEKDSCLSSSATKFEATSDRSGVVCGSGRWLPKAISV